MRPSRKNTEMGDMESSIESLRPRDEPESGKDSNGTVAAPEA